MIVAAAYSAEQSAAQEQLRKQQEEALRQRQEATARSASKPDVASDSIKPMATSGIQTLPQNKTAAVSDQFHRIGAICGDGSESAETGHGACSHHSGVRCWKYADGTCHK
jgi:hypothetical protein